MNENAITTQSVKSKIKDLVTTALLISMVFIATMFINIRLPISVNGGLIHLGTGMLYISAIVFGKKKGAIAGAFGMSLFDVVSGWVLWAPFTFVIRGVMGYIVGSIANSRDKDGKSFVMNILAVLVGGAWMIIGYYITEVILYGNWITPVTSIPGNVFQIVLGSISLAVAPILKRVKAL